MKQEVKDILNRFEEYGYQAYIVGGYVRDFLLGKISEDVDIATDATPEEMKNLFSDYPLSGDEHFGNVNIGDVQVTTFRKDIYESGNRFPQVIYTKDIKEDVLRRDFTMNSLYMDKDENIIDYVGGVHDIEKNLIRTVKNPAISLKEDPIRIVRAIRFMKSLDFTLEEGLKEEIKKNLHLLEVVSKKRIEREIGKGKVSFEVKDISENMMK